MLQKKTFQVETTVNLKSPVMSFHEKQSHFENTKWFISYIQKC